MQLHVVAGDELPIYRQIMRQITDAVASGRLERGQRLPSQRELAEVLVISPLTVKKAYDELEREGIIRTQQGRGTFVHAEAPLIDPAQQRQRLREAVRRLLSRAHLMGVPFADVQGLLAEVHEELRSEQGAAGRQEEPTS